MKKPNEKTVYKGLGYCGFGMGSNSAEVDVADGKVIRIRPMQYDKKHDPSTYRPWRITAKGKVFEPTNKSLLPPLSTVYKKRTYSPNRVLYPLKRVDWDPNGERNTQNRGTSKFERISWDEALDLIASEIKRIHSTYSPFSILCQADGHGDTKNVHGGPHGAQTHLLKLMGGYTLQARQPDSWEGWYWGAKHMWGQDPIGQGFMGNCWQDISENSDMLLYWGCDNETTPWGWSGQMASRVSYWFSELGIKSVFVCPDVNYSAAVHADKWIPVLPNTDAALQLAIAYTWLKEDTYDKEYLKTHAHRFEEFADYVLGKKDGIPKDPAWASPKCGVPTYTIKALARQWALMPTSLVHGNGGSYIRSTYATEPARLEVALLGMQALGKPGRNQLKMIEWGMYGMRSMIPHPPGEFMPTVRGAYTGYIPATSVNYALIPKTMIPQAILGDWTSENPMTWYGQTFAGMPTEDQFVEYYYPIAKEDGGERIHMIWSDAPCWQVCWNGGNEMTKALQSPEIEFLLYQHPWLENDTLFGDIILPCTTKLEEEDIGVDTFAGQYYTVMYEERCVEPLGESMSDYEIVKAVAKRLGVKFGKETKELIKSGFEQSGVQGRMTYEEFLDKGYYVVPTVEGWEDDPAGFYEFYMDPKKHPLTTPTGKLEYVSEGLSEYFPDDPERPLSPQWIESGETHPDERLTTPRGKKYPFLVVSNHPRWRVHANLDDVSWLREIETCKVTGPDGYQYEPIWINPKDAAKYGIKNGDVVAIYNERGETWGGAYITERIMQNVVLQDHGAHTDHLEIGKVDRSGTNNLICPSGTTSKNAAGEVTSGYLVALRKVDIAEEMKKYPEEMSRETSPSGVLKSNYIIGEGK